MACPPSRYKFRAANEEQLAQWMVSFSKVPALLRRAEDYFEIGIVRPPRLSSPPLFTSQPPSPPSLKLLARTSVAAGPSAAHGAVKNTSRVSHPCL